MAAYSPYEHMGRAECSKCGRKNREEWRIVDTATGRKKGTRVVRYQCACVGTLGEVLSDTNTFD